MSTSEYFTSRLLSDFCSNPVHCRQSKVYGVSLPSSQAERHYHIDTGSKWVLCGQEAVIRPVLKRNLSHKTNRLFRWSIAHSGCKQPARAFQVLKAAKNSPVFFFSRNEHSKPALKAVMFAFLLSSQNTGGSRNRALSRRGQSEREISVPLVLCCPNMEAIG